MKPRSVSATSLQTASACLSRYKAEHIDYARGMSNDAALLGTSVHGALEMFVKACYLEKSMTPSIKLLLDFFRMSYISTFGTGDASGPDYDDGVDMLERWYKRTDFSTFEVISCEVKENIPIKSSIGDIPFNYIWDRHDKIGENEYRVVDYKTNRWGIQPGDLFGKIQARAYGLAAQIKYPDAERIWVEFDMLRHDGPVGVSYSRADNVATWKFLKASVQRIVDTPDEDAWKLETVNEGCNFCVRKASCKTLLKNIAAGGVHSLGGIGVEIINTRAQLEYQRKAIESAIKEIDTVILEEAREQDIMDFHTDAYTLKVAASRRRAVDPERVEMILGPVLMGKYGKSSITLTTVEKLLKGSELSEQQKSQLRGAIFFTTGEPRVKIESANPIDGA